MYNNIFKYNLVYDSNWRLFYGRPLYVCNSMLKEAMYISLWVADGLSHNDRSHGIL